MDCFHVLTSRSISELLDLSSEFNQITYKNAKSSMFPLSCATSALGAHINFPTQNVFARYFIHVVLNTDVSWPLADPDLQEGGAKFLNKFLQEVENSYTGS